MQRPGSSAFRRLAALWASFSSAKRRRIVLGALLAVSVAAWDMILLVVVGGLFALSELVPAGRPAPRRASS